MHKSLLLCVITLAAVSIAFAASVSYNLRVNPNMKYEDGSPIPASAVVQYRLYFGDCVTPPSGAKTTTLAPGIVNFQHVSNDGDAQVCIYSSQIADGVEGDYYKTPYTVPARPLKKKPSAPAGISRQ